MRAAKTNSVAQEMTCHKIIALLNSLFSDVKTRDTCFLDFDVRKLRSSLFDGIAETGGIKRAIVYVEGPAINLKPAERK